MNLKCYIYETWLISQERNFKHKICRFLTPEEICRRRIKEIQMSNFNPITTHIETGTKPKKDINDGFIDATLYKKVI